MNNFQIKGNIILLNDGYDLKDIVGGVAHTVIDHTLAVGNMMRIRGAKLAGGDRHAGQGRLRHLDAHAVLVHLFAHAQWEERNGRQRRRRVPPGP